MGRSDLPINSPKVLSTVAGIGDLDLHGMQMWGEYASPASMLLGESLV